MNTAPGGAPARQLPAVVPAPRPDVDGVDRPGQTVATVERAMDVLIHFSRVSTPDLGVTEIATALSLSKAAVHRILTSLRTRNLVDFDAQTRRYRLGPLALTLGLTYLSHIDVRALARPELVALSAATNETATLSIRIGDGRVYIDQVVPSREIAMSVEVGVPYPLHAGASSKALLAFLPREETDRVLAGGLPRITDKTITSVTTLRRDLARVRTRGYAISTGERQSGAASVAAPILDGMGHVVAVVSVSGPAGRIEADKVAPALLAAIERISAQLEH
ncbi:IclR family transcriptional regulator [Dactylosporangium sucinum]|uniref:IclR family transcriptional regulator n=2 Tax=Dactylosporangium sucinum TaxID=1424081 RepID=A0A917TZ99_9ACTN|nr:IclR family transcriptional regulator [Dactylosporangium sucinum]